VCPLAQLVCVKGDRAVGQRGEDMGEMPCMGDTACRVVLAGRTQDVAGKRVSVDAVDVDVLEGHAWREHLRQDGGAAIGLLEDKKDERSGKVGLEMGASHTINCRRLRMPLRVSGMREIWTGGIRGRIRSGGIGRRRACSRRIAWNRWRWTNRSIWSSAP
jgi:hypothetical protein